MTTFEIGCVYAIFDHFSIRRPDLTVHLYSPTMGIADGASIGAVPVGDPVRNTVDSAERVLKVVELDSEPLV